MKKKIIALGAVLVLVIGLFVFKQTKLGLDSLRSRWRVGGFSLHCAMTWNFLFP